MGQWDEARAWTRSALGLWGVTRGPGEEHPVGVRDMRGAPLFIVANWRKNHAISMTTFTDEFDLGESLEARLKLLRKSGVPPAGLEMNCRC